jgi:hypothetical protein
VRLPPSPESGKPKYQFGEISESEMRPLLRLSEGVEMMQPLPDVSPQLEKRFVRGENHAGHNRKEKRVKLPCWGSNFGPSNSVD